MMPQKLALRWLYALRGSTLAMMPQNLVTLILFPLLLLLLLHLLLLCDVGLFLEDGSRPIFMGTREPRNSSASTMLKARGPHCGGREAAQQPMEGCNSA